MSKGFVSSDEKSRADSQPVVHAAAPQSDDFWVGMNTKSLPELFCLPDDSVDWNCELEVVLIYL